MEGALSREACDAMVDWCGRMFKILGDPKSSCQHMMEDDECDLYP